MGLVRLNRGQLVLAAAAIVAVALVPVLFAYLQLGYHPDVGSTPEPETPGEDAIAHLDRAAHDAETSIAGEYAWDECEDAAAAVRDELEGPIESLETSRIDSGTAYEVSYDDAYSTERPCLPTQRGSDGDFGPCHADDGVVFQSRAGEAVLLAVAFDVVVTTPNTDRELSVLVSINGDELDDCSGVP